MKYGVCERCGQELKVISARRDGLYAAIDYAGHLCGAGKICSYGIDISKVMPKL